MTSLYLIVDGFRYSTGIRDQFSGEYLALENLLLSTDFRHRFASWLHKYQQAHVQYDDVRSEPYLKALDKEGIELAKELKMLLGGGVKIQYYSDAFGTSYLT